MNTFFNARLIVTAVLASAAFVSFACIDKGLPEDAEENVSAAEKAAEYAAELDRIAGEMSRESGPGKLREKGIEISAIEEKASNLNATLGDTSEPGWEKSRQAIKAALRNITVAANALKRSEEALRLGINEIDQSENESANGKLSNQVAAQAEVSGLGVKTARKAATHLRRARAYLRTASKAIRKAASEQSIDSEEFNQRLAALDRQTATIAGKARSLARRIAAQVQQLSTLAGDLQPAPVVAEPTVSCTQRDFVTKLTAFDVKVTNNLDCNDAYNLIEAMISQCDARFMQGFEDCPVLGFKCSATTEPDGASYLCRSSVAAVRFYRGG